MTVRYEDVTACLVTRGDVPMAPIIETLPYGAVKVFDNSEYLIDLRVYGRYQMTKEARTKYVYFQDDDVVFTEHEKLLAEFNKTPNIMVANNAHGPNTGGYDDLALSAAGAILRWQLVDTSFSRWFNRHPGFTPGLLYEADFIFGILTPYRQIDLPYTRLYADDDTRLCRQSWQEDLKLEMTNLARAVRDGDSG